MSKSKKERSAVAKDEPKRKRRRVSMDEFKKTWNIEADEAKAKKAAEKKAEAEREAAQAALEAKQLRADEIAKVRRLETRVEEVEDAIVALRDYALKHAGVIVDYVSNMRTVLECAGALFRACDSIRYMAGEDDDDDLGAMPFTVARHDEAEGDADNFEFKDNTKSSVQ